MRKDYLASSAIYIFWGIATIYWKTVGVYPPLYIMASRVIYSFAICLIGVIIFKEKDHLLAVLKQKKTLLLVFFGATILGINWYFFIFAMNTSQVVEASMGLYIGPLVSVLLGLVFFKESLDKFQITAILLAFTGIAYLVVAYGKVPYISIILGFAFASYGAIKKRVKHVNVVVSMFLETAFLLTPALMYVFYIEGASASPVITNTSAFGVFIIIFSGAMTILPLMAFSFVAKTVPLSVLAFFQYGSSTLTLLVGVVLYNERITNNQWVAFIFIWTALTIFTVSRLYLNKKAKTLPA